MRSHFVSICLLLSLAVGCSESDSPTAVLPLPRTIDGVFVGTVSVQPPGEDWSSVTLKLESAGNVSGTLTPKSGTERPVRGAYVGQNLILDVGELNESSCVELTLNGFRFERDASNRVTAFDGSVQGRCPAPVTGTFSMKRNQ